MDVKINCVRVCAGDRIHGVTGLRERKKQRTREQIVEAAYGLFRDRGFHATTVADIAAAADISPRTFFAYFPSKEAVVFHEFDALFAAFREMLEARPENESALDALRTWLATVIPDKREPSENDLLRKHMCDVEMGLAAHEQHLRARFEEILAEGVARDLGVPVDSLRPRLVAGAAVAALTSIDKDGANREQSLALLDEAFTFLRGGVAALQERG